MINRIDRPFKAGFLKSLQVSNSYIWGSWPCVRGHANNGHRAGIEYEIQVGVTGQLSSQNSLRVLSYLIANIGEMFARIGIPDKTQHLVYTYQCHACQVISLHHFYSVT